MHMVRLGLETLVALALVSLACGNSTTSDDAAGRDHGAARDAGPSGEGAADSDDCGCGALEQCFGGTLCVARLVSVKGGYAIDATEVTRQQYAAWLATSPSVTGQDPGCDGWNTSYLPETAWPERACDSTVWPPGSKGDHPVVCVDWCDAYAYCKAVGKRLCGAIGGGPEAWADHANAAKSQWYNACSSGGAHNYPYGGDPSVTDTDGFQKSACNGSENGLKTTAPVAALSGCQSTDSGFAGVLDLSGNVREWEDACEPGFNGAPCRVRGGSFGDSYYGGLRCRDDMYLYREHLWGDVGFRCCAP